MLLWRLAAILAALTTLTPANASERIRLGYGRLITNDYIVDGQDRWRTGSVSSSRVWGPEWTGALPQGFGNLIELRLGAEIFAPERLGSPVAGDRPYAGALSVGAHTHFARAGYELSAGADLVFTGPSTGLGALQREFHDLVGVNQPSDAVLDAQIGNGLHPTVVLEVGRRFDMGDRLSLRPFVEARAGAETLLRAGFDLTLGAVGQGELLVRESSTGQRYRVIENDKTGYSFVLGGDIAKVGDSIFLPSSRGYTLTDHRDRLRAGLHWQGETATAFYGLTYLGEEFAGQGEGQLLGSVRVRLEF